MYDANQTPSAEYLKLRAIFENAVDAIISIDERGVIDSVNPATQTLFGYALDELLGRNVSILMPAQYGVEHDRYLNNYLQSGNRKIIGIGREAVGQRKDGSTFPMHLAVSEMTHDGRRIFTGIVRDISDLKEAERKLEQLNCELEHRVRQRTAQLRQAQSELMAKEKLATLGQVSGGIAHEIRNPLNAVKASTYYLLHAKNASDEERKEHLERINRQVTLIDGVITALSEVAKLPQPGVTGVPTDAILREVVREVSLPARIAVQHELPESGTYALVDERQIRIVFRNLLRNARDAMPDGGTITIAARQAGDKIAISVRDTGIGIAEEELKRVLEPLYSTKTRGLGLGLAICKAIVERNGGQLKIESQLGKGSTFTVELPASQPL
jgi:two-component system sensor kinase FixL